MEEKIIAQEASEQWADVEPNLAAPVESAEVTQAYDSSTKTKEDSDISPASELSAGQVERAGPKLHKSLSFLQPGSQPGSLGRLGHFEVLELLGKGGFGIVLKAFDEKLRRMVAIKVLGPQLVGSANARSRFVREARTAASVNCKYVVSTYEVHEQPIPYLVMEYVAGKSLQERIDRLEPFTIADILRIGAEMAAGLGAAHEQGLIHRDIKPANILLEDRRPLMGHTEQLASISEQANNTSPFVVAEFARIRDARQNPNSGEFGYERNVLSAAEKLSDVGRVKIADFGLAKAVDDVSLTQSGIITGTPQFMSPEQARGEPLDHRSDLFSLGSVLYAMCTGHPPFQAHKTVGVMKRVCDDKQRPIREVNPAIPETLADIVNKLLVKDPAGRFQTAAEVAELLEHQLAHLDDATLSSRYCLPVDSEVAGQMPAISTKKRARGWKWAAAAVVLFPVIALAATELAGLTHLFRQRWTAHPSEPGGEPALGRIANNETPTPKATQEPLPATFKNSIGMEFVIVPKGKSRLGGSKDRPGDKEVEISDDFYLGKYEVTQEEWTQVMGANPSHFSRTGGGKDAVKEIPDADLKRFPVENVSWPDCRLFAAKLNELEAASGWVYRLPMEAEWEYACRGGDGNPLNDGFDYYFEQPTNTLLPEMAHFNYGDTALKRTCKVGSYQPNHLGLYDMHGNVWEWCQDAVPANPKDPKSVFQRAHWGGSWLLDAGHCRVAQRGANAPWVRAHSLGLRLARVPSTTAASQLVLALDHLRLGEKERAQQTLRLAVANLKPLGESTIVLELVCEALREFGFDGPEAEVLLAAAAGELPAALTEAIRKQPKLAAGYLARGNWYGRRGLWRKAADDLVAAYRLQPRAYEGLQIAILLAQLGETNRYREHCRELLDRFASTKDNSQASKAIKSCCMLGSGPVGDSAQLANLAEVAVSGDLAQEWYEWFVLSKGLFEYRSGHFQSAVTSVRAARAEAKIGRVDSLIVATFSIESMALLQCGDTDDARRALAAAKKLIDEKLRVLLGIDLGDSWHDVLTAYFLYGQAEAMVERAERFTAVLQGKETLKYNAERLAFAKIAYDQKKFAFATRLWAEALESDPKLGDDRQAQHRYDAARAAALAASGQGQDELTLDDAAKAKLRRQALDWLNAERMACDKLIKSKSPWSQNTVQKLSNWKLESALAGIRDPAALAKLPTDESAAFEQLWADVGGLDTLLLLQTAAPPLLQMAAQQAWLGQDKELAAICERALHDGMDTKDPTTAERTAKICSLRQADAKTHLAALVLARRAVELGKKHIYLVYFHMCLGMAEYRCGHFAEADTALLAASRQTAGTQREYVAVTSSFYRAMSLFRQGKETEARKLAIAMVPKMTPIPADEKNLANTAGADSLILWMAYKEAKALIQFDKPAPVPDGELLPLPKEIK